MTILIVAQRRKSIVCVSVIVLNIVFVLVHTFLYMYKFAVFTVANYGPKISLAGMD